MRIREPEPQRCVTRPREGDRPRAALVSGRSPGQRYAAVALGPNVPSQVSVQRRATIDRGDRKITLSVRVEYVRE